MCVACYGRLSRRGALGLLAAAPLAACSDNAETGRKQFVVVPDDQLAALADRSWAELRAQTPVLRDPEQQARLERVGRRIVAATGRTDLDWEFVVFDSPDLNAFVLPNGKVAFFRGILELTADDHEIAAVMGHEAAHILARHPSERVSQQLAVQAGVGLAQLLLTDSFGENAADVAAALGMGVVYGVVLPYSRKHELEADKLGVELMGRAGFRPAAALQFWRRMIASRPAGSEPPEVLSTHPADSTRLAALQQAIGAAGAPA